MLGFEATVAMAVPMTMTYLFIISRYTYNTFQYCLSVFLLRTSIHSLRFVRFKVRILSICSGNGYGASCKLHQSYNLLYGDSSTVATKLFTSHYISSFFKPCRSYTQMYTYIALAGACHVHIHTPISAIPCGCSLDPSKHLHQASTRGSPSLRRSLESLQSLYTMPSAPRRRSCNHPTRQIRQPERTCR